MVLHLKANRPTGAVDRAAAAQSINLDLFLRRVRLKTLKMRFTDFLVGAQQKSNGKGET